MKVKARSIKSLAKATSPLLPATINTDAESLKRSIRSGVSFSCLDTESTGLSNRLHHRSRCVEYSSCYRSKGQLFYGLPVVMEPRIALRRSVLWTAPSSPRVKMGPCLPLEIDVVVR